MKNDSHAWRSQDFDSSDFAVLHDHADGRQSRAASHWTSSGPRDLVYVVGATLPELGGSEYLAMQGYTGNAVPKVDADEAIRTYQAMAKATAAGLCRSIHTPALGGLAVALAKSAIGGQLGIEADLSLVPTAGDLDLNGLLFSETNSRFVVTVCPDNWQKFEALFEADQAVACIGKVTRDPALVLASSGKPRS